MSGRTKRRAHVQFTIHRGYYDIAQISPEAARALLQLLPAKARHPQAQAIIDALRYISTDKPAPDEP